MNNTCSISKGNRTRKISPINFILIGCTILCKKNGDIYVPQTQLKNLTNKLYCHMFSPYFDL